MPTATTRKIGNSVSIAIPKQLGVEPGVDYLIYKEKNGTIVMAPRIGNPFKSGIIYKAEADDFWQKVAEKGMDYQARGDRE